MHYVTHRSHQMRKQKFGITSPEALFVKSEPAPPELEKYCVDDSLSGCTEMHYVTRRSHRMQKQKFGVMCPMHLLSNPYWSQPSMKNSVLTLQAPDIPKCTM
jgi:hypothetical protein